MQSRGSETREVGWVQSSAMLVRRSAAEQVGYLDPEFFVYSDETDFCRGCATAAGRILYVPAAQAVHHDQLGERLEGARPPRGRVLTATATSTCASTRALAGRADAPAARVSLPAAARTPRWRPGPRPRAAIWLHFTQALRPGSGEGIREAAEAYNRRLAGPASVKAPEGT